MHNNKTLMYPQYVLVSIAGTPHPTNGNRLISEDSKWRSWFWGTPVTFSEALDHYITLQCQPVIHAS